MPLPAPVTTATWPVKGLATAPFSLACSRLQYSTSNRSLSGSASKRPIASASVMTLTAVSARSAAMAASLRVAPTPNRPTPGTSTRRGIGSSLVLTPPTRAFSRTNMASYSAMYWSTALAAPQP